MHPALLLVEWLGVRPVLRVHCCTQGIVTGDGLILEHQAGLTACCAEQQEQPAGRNTSTRRGGKRESSGSAMHMQRQIQHVVSENSRSYWQHDGSRMRHNRHASNAMNFALAHNAHAV
jgi:hypothetical protein